MSRIGTGRTAGGFPRLTNVEASGLILFARAVAADAASRGTSLAFDWYGFALPALGWSASGDQFQIDAPAQQREYAPTGRLWLELQAMARQLDDQSVPFKPLRAVTGTVATMRELAAAAWEHMQRESPAEAQASRAAAGRRRRPAPAPAPRETAPDPEPEPEPTPERPAAAERPAVDDEEKDDDDDDEDAEPARGFDGLRRAARRIAKKPKEDAGGSGAGILLLLAVLAFTQE